VHNQGKLRLRIKAKRTNRAGSTCDDQADNCGEFITFCAVAEYKSTLSKYCHKSCGYCARDTSDCVDATQFQSTWVFFVFWERNGLLKFVCFLFWVNGQKREFFGKKALTNDFSSGFWFFRIDFWARWMDGNELFGNEKKH
jgi:hypothetical protein